MAVSHDMSDVKSGDQSFVTSRHLTTTLATIFAALAGALVAMLVYNLSTIDKLRDKMDAELRLSKRETIDSIERIVINNKNSLQQQILERQRTVDGAIKQMHEQFSELRLANQAFGQHLLTIASGNVRTKDVSKLVEKALEVYSSSPKNWKHAYVDKLKSGGGM